MSQSKEIQRGHQAEMLLNNELFKEAFDTVEEAIVEAWKNAPIRDQEGAHELKLMLTTLRQVKGYVQEVVNTGKLAAITRENS